MAPDGSLLSPRALLLAGLLAGLLASPGAARAPAGEPGERAPSAGWWSLEPVRVPPLPAVADRSWPRNPIDIFVLAALEDEGLRPAPAAPPRVLIRRLSFDLLGLAPSPEEVESFAAEPSGGAYAALAERYLASPHLGERWARHWLDVARFGESQGFERDRMRPNAWRYRDWVLDAFNDDMPYDHFVRLQVAGDVLEPGEPEAIAATGFLVAGAWDMVGQEQQSAAMRAVVRQDEIEDIVGTVGQAFLGLTVHCARCHDHKFDPVPQAEYYRLASALDGVHHGERDIATPLFRERAAAQAAGIEAQAGALLARIREPPPAGAGGEAAAESEALRAEVEHLRLLKERALATAVYAVVPRQPEPTRVLERGSPASPGAIVTPGGIAAIAGLDADFGLPADAPEGERRARLARWITDPRNPLVARVIVNRIWHHHFGLGLVETPNDLGAGGARPSHPELLDWLAGELIRSEWSLKRIHRLIVTSSTYRQGSRFDARAAARDAENRLLWRHTPRRLEAECVRDGVLQLAGELNREVGGPGYHDFVAVFFKGTEFYEPRRTFGASFNRRSLYRTWARGGRNRLLDVFDCPDPSTTAPRRGVTTTPLQALSLMNSDFALAMAKRASARIEREAGADVERQVARALALAWGRLPEPGETAPAAAFIKEHGLAAFCRVLINSNELLHVD